MTTITTRWRVVMRSYSPELPDSENGYTYTNFDCETEHEAALTLEEYERIYSGYPVDFWIEEIMTEATCY